MKSDAGISRAARRLRLVTLGAVGLIALATLAGLWMLLVGPITGIVSMAVDTGGLTGLPGAIALLVSAVLLAVALLQLAAMLRIVEGGGTFAAAGRFRAFAFYLFLAVLSAILLPPALHLASEGVFHFSLDSGQALMLFVTGLLFFVARLLEEAQRVAEDHEQIV